MKDILGMAGMAGMMGKLQNLQSNMQTMQQELAALELTGDAGGGMVQITLSGKGDVLRAKIDPALLKPDEVEILEDLIVTAARAAKAKVEEEMKSRMEQVTGGLPIPPGMKLF
jgi:nucleoid-associated protein EbfC